jgi:glutamyl-tRNA synthetase
MNDAILRTRFAPSPTGYLHVGGARTALFNWLLARRHAGRFILRIEDTDQTRNLPDAERKLCDDLRWLGLEWDEGPDVGGPHGPYRQSERLDAYHAASRRLLEAGQAYHTFETPDELEAMRRVAAAAKRPFRYPRPDVLPTAADVDRARGDGRPVVVRFKVPEVEFVVHDLILGEVRFAPGEVEDFVILKSNGWPTYHFAVVVDDEHMQITHVLRAQEHLMNTPKHIALQQALGFRTPAYAHLPLVFNMDGTKMSKRDKQKDIDAGRPPREIDVHDFRCAGYLPEAIVNFIALLGWSPGEDREKLTRDEMVALFSIERINKTAARFDRDKLLAMNTDYAAAASPERLLAGFRDYAVAAGSTMAALDDDTLRRALDACRGFNTFAHVEQKAGVLFLSDEAVRYDPDAVRKVLAKKDGQGYAVLEQIGSVLESLSDWSPPALDACIKTFCEQNTLKFADVAQPLRVAVTGRTISPAIGDTLALLGKAKTLARLRRCLTQRV